MIVCPNTLEISFSGASTIGDKYVMTNQLLGTGSYAKVFKGHLKANPNILIAVKEIDIAGKKTNAKFMQTLDREITILRRLNHPNIIQLFDVVRLPEKLFIFLELCDSGDLKQLMAQKKTFSEKEVIPYIHQITSAFQTMYTNNIIHRDLKPANILLNKGTLKITDFGFAREISCGMDEPAALTRYGSPLYMSPQILQGKPFSSKCDVWSLGIITFQMLYGKTPWTGLTPPDLLKNIMENQEVNFPEEFKVSQGLRNLIKKMLVIEDGKRLSWPDVFKSEILNGGEKLGDGESLGKGGEESLVRKSIKKKICCCFGGE